MAAAALRRDHPREVPGGGVVGADQNAVASPLHRMLMRDAESADVPAAPPVPDDDDVVALFASWRDRGGPAPEPALHADPGADRRDPTRPPSPPGRSPAGSTPEWRRASYSSSAGSRSPPGPRAPSSAAEVGGRTDDVEPVEITAAAGRRRHAVADGGAAGGRDVRLARARRPRARRSRGPRPAPRSCSRIDDQLGWWPVALRDGRALLRDRVPRGAGRRPGGGVRPPLGCSRHHLRQLPLSDRLREMEFELPLGNTLGDTLLRHRAAPGRHLPPGPGPPVRKPARRPLGEQTLRATSPARSTVLRLQTLEAAVTSSSTTRPTGWGRPTSRSRRTATAPRRWAAAMGHLDSPSRHCCCTPGCTGSCGWRQPGYDRQHPGGCSTSTCAACADPTRPGRRAPCGCLVLASAGRAGRGAPTSWTVRQMTELFDVRTAVRLADRHHGDRTARRRSTAGVLTSAASTSQPASVPRAASRRADAARLGWRSPSAPPDRGVGVPRSGSPGVRDDPAGLGWPRRVGRWVASRRLVPPGVLRWESGRSPSTATTGSEARVHGDPSPGSTPRSSTDEERLARARQPCRSGPAPSRRRRGRAPPYHHPHRRPRHRGTTTVARWLLARRPGGPAPLDRVARRPARPRPGCRRRHHRARHRRTGPGRRWPTSWAGRSA